MKAKQNITEKEVPLILEEELPDITSELEKNSENILRIFNCFTNYTKKCAEKGNINKLKKCFKIADKFLKQGNNIVKSALENIFIFSVSSFIEIVSPVQEQVKKILPEKLKNACLKHYDYLSFHNDFKDENCLFQNEIIELQ